MPWRRVGHTVAWMSRVALRRRTAAAVVALAAAPLSACGGEASEDEVRAAWEEAADAIAAGSATDFCALVSAEGKEAITERAGLSCEDAIRLVATQLGAEDKARIRVAEIVQVDVSGDEATVRYESDAALARVGLTGRTSLVRVDGRWLLRGI
jgi:hypothetical protein